MTDLETIRRDLIGLRVAHGADSPIGHRCSNIVELIQNYEWVTTPGTVRSWPTASTISVLIEKQMTDLARLRAGLQ